jgi:hypothetical protein
MKRTLLCAAFITALSVPAFAVAPTWQGDMFVTVISEVSPGVSCKNVNVAVGDFYRTVLRPKNLTAESGTSDLIAFHSNRSAIWLKPTSPVVGQLNGATQASINIIYGSSGFNAFTARPITASVSPYPVALTTASVTVTMTIQNVFSKDAVTPSGCNATVKGVLGKRLS